ncbi:MAG: hypothetical protein ABIS74_11315 [Ferruginibacter sp.]
MINGLQSIPCTFKKKIMCVSKRMKELFSHEFEGNQILSAVFRGHCMVEMLVLKGLGLLKIKKQFFAPIDAKGILSSKEMAKGNGRIA